MTRAALHINDAGITILDTGRIHYRQPGFALLDDETLTTGHDAFARARINPRHVQHRYWSDLTTEALRDTRFCHLSPADLVSRQLEQAWQAVPADIDELVVAVPGFLSSEHLGLFLGIARDLTLPVVALADAAVAATRREYRNAVPVHIDMGLHATTMTRIAQDGHARVERTEVLENCGIYALNDAWLTAVAEAFVRQSRFDPLHTADTEQLLLDQLGAWLAQAGRDEQVELELQSGGVAHRAEIEPLALIGAAAPWYQQIANRLRALIRADEIAAIQLTDRVSRLPGLADMLTARVGGEIYALEAGATARGARSRVAATTAAAQEAVKLLRQLPWDQAAVTIEADPAGARTGGVPTHLLFGHVAWRIEEAPLTVGTQAEERDRRIPLDGEMPGVSRRHCVVRRANGQCIVEDYSRYGTFLNGHRIDGSTVLQVGDSLRVDRPASSSS